MRKNVMVIVTIISSVVIMTGVVIGALTLGGFGDDGVSDIIFSEDKLEGTVEFREMLIHPGETLYHKVLLKNKVEGECTIKINFDEYKPEFLANELQKYVYVTVTLGEGTICENVLLGELFTTELPETNCLLSDKDPLEMNISFHMPEEIGNEAELTEAFFDVVINVSNE